MVSLARQHLEHPQVTVKAKVRCLEGHLNERIRAESMAGDKVLSVPLEFQSLAIVLTDQVA